VSGISIISISVAYIDNAFIAAIYTSQHRLLFILVLGEVLMVSLSVSSSAIVEVGVPLGTPTEMIVMLGPFPPGLVRTSSCSFILLCVVVCHSRLKIFEFSCWEILVYSKLDNKAMTNSSLCRCATERTSSLYSLATVVF